VSLDRNNLRVHISSMRRKMRDHGVTIQTVWDYGYQLSPCDQAVVVKLILQPAADAR
jgi:DNA-binding response OmpR family regulator